MSATEVGHLPTGRHLGTLDQLHADHAVVRLYSGRVRAFPLAELVVASGRYLSPEDFATARQAAKAGAL